MNNKFEKLRDFLYESIDYFMIIGIIVLVTGIIGWRLDLLFTESDNSLLAQTTVEDKVQEINTKDKISESSQNKNVIGNNTLKDQFIKISVPPGSNSSSIAEILEDKGLIDNSSEFILKTEEMNLSTKLKSGDFELNSDDNLEEIIHILTR